MAQVIKFVPPSAKHPGMKSRPIWWDELHLLMWNMVTHTLKPLYPEVTHALVITRGGQGVSSLLSAMCEDIKVIETMGIRSYAPNKEQKQLKVHKNIGHEWLNEVRDLKRKIFVFEDVGDTGKTAELIRLEMKRLRIVDYVLIAAVVKPAGKALVDHFALEVEQDCWVDFPWDWQVVTTEEGDIRSPHEEIFRPRELLLQSSSLYAPVMRSG